MDISLALVATVTTADLAEPFRRFANPAARVVGGMAEFTYGPVDLVSAAFDGDRPDPDVLAALAELVESGQVRVLDLLVVQRDDDGDLSFSDLDTSDPAYVAFASVELLAQGVVTLEDAAGLVTDLAPSSGAVVVALELTWATALANRLAATGGVVLETVRIPAPVVNAVMDTVVSA
ncbi:MAG: hypothetical protein KDC46_00135 [Thermoleophilia bacterium]|nr:hypothetical protein [Thermoleophilia bacterium]